MDGMHDPEKALRAAGAREEHFSAPPPLRGKAYGRLRVLLLSDAMNAPHRSYLLRGLIAPSELSVWWGAPKCGKSFLLLRLAYGLALGQGMWGRSARSCRVLYVAAEGEGGFATRLIALRDVMGDVQDAFQYIAQRTTVGPPADDLNHLIDAARDMDANLIVLDTLARTFGDGDENAARDMGGFVTSVDKLRTDTGAHVAVIHHGTKEGGSSRGSSALSGAADLIVKVAKDGSGGPNVATVTDAKEDVSGDALAFRLRVIDLEPGEDGTPRSTCIAEEAEVGAEGSKSLPPTARDALTYLGDLVTREGRPLPIGPLYPPNMFGVSESRWREECQTRRLSMAETEQSRARVFRSAAQKLRERYRIAMRDGWVWIV